MSLLAYTVRKIHSLLTLSVPSYSTGLLLKPYVKVMTQKLEWWIILMVDYYCVTPFVKTPT